MKLEGQKTNLSIWLRALITSGSLSMLFLAGFGLWTLFSRPPSAIAQPSPSTIPLDDRIVGRWSIKGLPGCGCGETTLIFTSDGKLYTIQGVDDKGIEYIKELEYKKISDEGTLPPNVRVPDPEKVSQFEAKVYVRSITRSQRAFYLEKQRFTTDIKLLGFEINPETENYSYRIITDGLQSAQNIGLAKKDNLKSYIGFSWIGTAGIGGDATILTILCESDRPTTTMPAKPRFSDTAATCPTGYSRVTGIYE